MYARTGHAAQPDIAEEHGVDRYLDTMGDPDVADHRAGSCDGERGRHGLPCPDAFEGRVDANPIRQLQDCLVRCVTTLGEDVGGTKRPRQRLAGRVAAEGDDAGGAQAPSPTTATTLPGFTPALTAAWWPVHITSVSASSERMVSFE